jgi:alpha-1,3/alpha-1,6-mannosyltransferase
MYRIPFDWIEEVTTGLSDAIVVNSLFTKGVFKDAFPHIDMVPDVIYPSVDVNPVIEAIPQGNSLVEFLKSFFILKSPDCRERKFFLSINRFERKKNIALAIESFASVPAKLRKDNKALLVIAGGHDPRNTENIEYSAELQNLSTSLSLRHTTLETPLNSSATPEIEVLFLYNVPSWLKSFLLSNAQILLYTPTNEHFGIVPLEAQLHNTPVLATPTGGPLETIEDNMTGYLRPDSQWSTILTTVLQKGINEEMGRRGKRRVIAEFSKDAMAGRFENECIDIINRTGGVGSARWMLKWDLWVGWTVVAILLGILFLQLSR